VPGCYAYGPAPAPTALALALAPLLTGCFASAGDESGEATGESGSRLRVALAFPPAENLSPYGADATILSRLGVTEGLTSLDANGSAAPALARSWQRESDRSWLFTLREATFQDGTDVTPARVAAALTHATEAKPAPAALSGVTLTAESAGGDRIRVTTNSPDPVLPLRLAGPALAVLSPKAYDEKGRVDPVGTATGPFELTKVTGSTAATSTASTTTGAASPRPPESTHGSSPTAPPAPTPCAPGRSTSPRRYPSPRPPPSTRPPAARPPPPAPRASNSTPGQARSRTRSSGPPPARPSTPPHSPRASTKVHADAGTGIYGPAVTWAAGKREQPAGRAKAAAPDGTTITLATYDNRPELPEAAQVLKQQLEKAGFKVELEVREYSRIESDALAGKFDAFVVARNTLVDTGDPVAVLASDYTCDGGYNLALLCDKDVDRAVAKAEGTADTSARQSAAMAAEAEILGADAVVPLVHQRVVTGVGTSVEGVLLDPYERTLVGTGTRR
jgi:peptide/nickel transport system substrate-binding protein